MESSTDLKPELNETFLDFGSMFQWIDKLSKHLELFTFIVLIITLIVLVRQLRVTNSNNERNANFQHVQIFLTHVHSVTELEYDNFFIHLEDHIDYSVFKEHYEGNPDRIKSYILMKKKYLYIFYTHLNFCTHLKSDPSNNFIVETMPAWLNELAKYREFWDIHERHRVYYPGFAKWAAEFTGQKGALVWFCQYEQNNSEEKQSN